MTKFETKMRQQVTWYGTHAFQLDEAEAVEAASYDGGNDRGIDLFVIDDGPERAAIAQGKYIKRADKGPTPEEAALLLRALDELEDPQGLRDAGRDDLADAAEDLVEAGSRGYTVDVKAGRKLEHWPLEKSSTRGRC